jgi:hypothetical protein
VKGKCGAMTKPRVTTADRLSNIFEVVELGLRSGLLTVERGSAQALEQGAVYFSQGRAVYAMVEELRGRDALTALGSWGQCRFAFEPNAPRPIPNIAEPQPTRPEDNGVNGMRGSGGYPPQRAQPTPTRGSPATFDWNASSNHPLPDPLTPTGYPGALPGQQRGPQSGPQTGPQSGGAPSTPSTPSIGASWPTGWPSNAPSNAPDRSNTSGRLNWPMPQTGALPAVPSGVSTPSQSTGPFAGGAPVSGEALERRPRRSPDVRDLIAVVSAFNLSRNHRTILLLADGEHTVHDLARLSSKSVDEIVALLADLERLGLVYYY